MTFHTWTDEFGEAKIFRHRRAAAHVRTSEPLVQWLDTRVGASDADRSLTM